MENKNWSELMSRVESIQKRGYTINITNNTYIAIIKDGADNPCVIMNDKRGLYLSLEKAMNEFDNL